MFFIYGAPNSKACEKAEFLLYTMNYEYRMYLYEIDYTLNQLQRLHPGTQTVPHIYYGTKYIGGVKELYEYLYNGQDNDRERRTKQREVKGIINFINENKQNNSENSARKEQ
jgi:glutaredoxin